MVVALGVALVIVLFAGLGVYELLAGNAGMAPALRATRRRNALFLALAALGALGLCAATAAFFGWGEYGVSLHLQQHIANGGILTAAATSLIALVTPRRSTPWLLKIAAMVPLPIAAAWVALAFLAFRSMRIQ